MPLQRLPPGRLDEELAKVVDRRDPPVPVRVWLLIDGQEHDAELLGWAPNPRRGDDGLRGLVRLVREFAPGFFAEMLAWVPVHDVRQR